MAGRPGPRRIAAAIAVLVAAGGCCPPGMLAAAPERGAADARIVLYRDRATVEEDVVATVAGGRASLPMPSDVAASELEISSDVVDVRSWTAAALDSQRDVTAVVGDRRTPGRMLGLDQRGVATMRDGQVEITTSPEALTGVRVLPLVVEVEGADGPARFRLRYQTTALAWQVGYTLVEDRPGHARLRANLTIDNRTARTWQRAALTVVDADGPAPARAADQVALPLPERLPGRYPIGPGEQRLGLALPERSLPLRSRLVYDPVGRALDRDQRMPVTDGSYGVRAWPDTLAEAIEVDLSPVAAGGLPPGPIALTTVGRDGALRWRGQGALSPPTEAASRKAIVTIGRVEDVTGRRRQTDLVRDDERLRLFEEYTVTVTNRRPVVIDVVVREHLYRGPCWILAYASTDRIEKIGAQEIALSARIPPAATVALVYRVIYKWKESECRE